jgi:hypothetical protein
LTWPKFVAAWLPSLLDRGDAEVFLIAKLDRLSRSVAEDTTTAG